MMTRLVLLLLAPGCIGMLACSDHDRAGFLPDPDYDGGRGWRTSRGNADAACVPGPGGYSVSGSVLVLDDPELEFTTVPNNRFLRTTEFSGTARVEIEAVDCGLVSTQTADEGAFELEGARRVADANYVRIFPVGSEMDLIPTFHLHEPDGPKTGLPLPLLSRNTLEGVLGFLEDPPELDETKAHVLVKILSTASLSPVEGATVGGIGGELIYDSGSVKTGTGPLGIAMFANIDAPEYPGEQRLFQAVGAGDDVEKGVLVAPGGVNLVLVTLGSGFLP